MKTLLLAAWMVWGISAIVFVADWLSARIFRIQQQLRVEKLSTDQMTTSDMRVSLMGDSRDPIERHIDAMTGFWRVAGLVVSGAFLYVLATTL